jgi:hypothetical protein
MGLLAGQFNNGGSETASHLCGVIPRGLYLRATHGEISLGRVIASKPSGTAWVKEARANVAVIQQLAADANRSLEISRLKAWHAQEV